MPIIKDLVSKITSRAVLLSLIPETGGYTRLSIRLPEACLPREQESNPFEIIETGIAEQLKINPSKISCENSRNSTFVDITIRCSPSEIRTILPQIQNPFLENQENRSAPSKNIR